MRVCSAVLFSHGPRARTIRRLTPDSDFLHDPQPAVRCRTCDLTERIALRSPFVAPATAYAGRTWKDFASLLQDPSEPLTFLNRFRVRDVGRRVDIASPRHLQSCLSVLGSELMDLSGLVQLFCRSRTTGIAMTVLEIQTDSRSDAARRPEFED